MCYSPNYVGSTLEIHGWVKGIGANQYGAWIDVKTFESYMSPAKIGAIRCYHLTTNRMGRGEYVQVVGKLSAPGQISVQVVTWAGKNRQEPKQWKSPTPGIPAGQTELLK